MKSIKFVLFVLFTALIHICALSQDTILFKDKQRIIAIVKEVSPTEVQYKKAEMPDGPMYIVSKRDIEKIIYKNGYTETFQSSVAASEPAPSTQVFTVQSATTLDPYLSKITYSDTKKRYYHMTSLIDRHPDQSRRESLTTLASSIKSLKRHQNGTRTGAIAFGGVALAGAAVYGLLSSVGAFDYPSGDGALFAASPLVFGTAAVILGSVSVAVTINLKKKRHEFVNLYNQ
ncbi:MAG: hypothetical protein HY062_12790 [Bacteroidetes bacterium]|nr:hypothetical protein [Bacteroidota bacterium]